MANSMVVTSDGGRARFFTYGRPAGTGRNSPGVAVLTEAHHLENPQIAMTGGEIFSTAKSGRNRAGRTGRQHPYDDHRTDHLREFEKRFAQAVAAETVTRARDEAVERVVLVASPGMLGALRPALGELDALSVSVEELPRDVSKLDAHKLHEYLSKQGVLPKREAVLRR